MENGWSRAACVLCKSLIPRPLASPTLCSTVFGFEKEKQLPKWFNQVIRYGFPFFFFFLNSIHWIITRIFFACNCKTRGFCRYLSVTKSHFCLEKYYIPAKRSSKVHISSSVLYTGCIPHIHVLALTTAQQLDMRVHNVFPASRKFFLEVCHSMSLLHCWPTSTGCLQYMRRNPLLIWHTWM